MKVDLLSLTDEPLGFTLKIPETELDLEDEGYRVVGDVDLSGELRRNAAKTDLNGAIHADLEIACTRCLSPVRTRLDVDFHVDFVGRELFPDSKEAQLEGGDLDTDVIEGNELDLTEVAREQILLNLPEATLCSENCKGICASCGKDLNEGDCDCGQDEIDPRWAALRGLKS